MDFKTYYETRFESDLRALLAAIPEKWRRTLWNDPAALTIQLDRLSKGDAIEVVPADRRPLFAVCLCWTALIDQAMYKCSGQYYESFRRLSAYPKLTGAGEWTWCHKCTRPIYAITDMHYVDEDGASKAKALMSAAKDYFRKDIPESLGKLFSIPDELSERIFVECLRELDKR
jgi:hypothetical protein